MTRLRSNRDRVPGNGRKRRPGNGAACILGRTPGPTAAIKNFNAEGTEFAESTEKNLIIFFSASSALKLLNF
jgi:hypothetical protein